MRSWLWPVVFKNSLFSKFIKNSKIPAHIYIKSILLLQSSLMHVWERFTHLPAKSDKPMKLNAAFTDQIATPILNISTMLYFFLLQILPFVICLSETYRLCCAKMLKTSENGCATCVTTFSSKLNELKCLLAKFEKLNYHKQY